MLVASKSLWLKGSGSLPRLLTGALSVLSLLPAFAIAVQYELTEDEEIDQALLLAPDLERGERIFEICGQCHADGAQGTPDGEYPQLAGQHRSVIIKQIADIRYGNRDNPTMEPFAQSSVFGSPQGLSDVAGYLNSLSTDPTPGVGPGMNLEYGAALYQENCATCHYDNGMGDDELLFPRLQGQHYAYLLRQLNWIQEGKRRNVYRGMVNKIRSMTTSDFEALSDYISRLPVPEETKQTPREPKFEDVF